MVLTLVAVQILVALLIAAQLLWAVRRGLKPLERLERQLDSRHYDDLAPLREEGAPRELGTFVTALNGLLLRIREGARNQRAFLDDMAHQLRTPLAGIQHPDPVAAPAPCGDAESAAALAQLQAATERMTRQTNQLLTLARAATARLESPPREPLRLDELIGEAMPSQLSQADGHGIDLGLRTGAADRAGQCLPAARPARQPGRQRPQIQPAWRSGHGAAARPGRGHGAGSGRRRPGHSRGGTRADLRAFSIASTAASMAPAWAWDRAGGPWG